MAIRRTHILRMVMDTAGDILRTTAVMAAMVDTVDMVAMVDIYLRRTFIERMLTDNKNILSGIKILFGFS